LAAQEVGSSYTSAIVVVDAQDAFVSPSTVTVTVTRPDRTTETPTYTEDSEGHFHLDYVLAQEGLYKFSWVTQTPYTAKTDFVSATEFRSVVGIDDVKSFINFESSGNEAILRQIMMTATELIEETVGTCVIRDYTNERVVGSTAKVLKLPMLRSLMRIRLPLSRLFTAGVLSGLRLTTTLSCIRLAARSS